MLNIIVAIDKKNGIGKDNDLLADIKPDMKHFVKTTKNSVVVMGYNTYLSLPGGPLKNRLNIVLTRKDIEIPGCAVMHSIDEFLGKMNDLAEGREVFVIGGASIYEQFMEHADRLHITHIFDTFEADTYFPVIDDSWALVSSTADRENIEHKHPHMFAVYEKK